MSKNFLDNIDLFCMAKHITKTDLLRDLGLPASTISMWRQRGSMPSAETIYKIAKYFNVSMEYLMYGENSVMDDDIVLAAAQLKTLTPEQRKPIMDLITTQVIYWNNIYNK